MIPLRFSNVSKKYLRHHLGARDDDFWAVRDVSFECHEGDVLGLVGRNGCGKSTILKLAANVTAPTTGRVEAIHPIAPMLELGAGFHPDLTGRDNIRLNGSLLGSKFTPNEFDQIVEFAELAAHIDTPVKHYSSGMSARLGFAIAVHSTARLLLIDEVLSVGDKLFQQKCLARMKELRDEGKTIVLVSHDDEWVRSFCTRALLIDKGALIADTTPDLAVQEYDLRLYNTNSPAHQGISISTVEVFTPSGDPVIQERLYGGALQVRIRYDVSAIKAPWEMILRMRREDGVYPVMLFHAPSEASGVVTVDISGLNLVVGRYIFEASVQDAETHTAFATQVSDYFYMPGDWDPKRGFPGMIYIQNDWHVEKE